MTSGGLFPQREPTGSWWRDHSLSIVLVALLVAQSVAFWVLRLPEWTSEQHAHGERFAWAPWLQHYWSEWFVSVLADTYGALLIVVLTKYLYERGSAESKGSAK